MFPMPFYMPRRTPSLSFRTSSRQFGGLTSPITFSSVDFGTVQSNRFIIVCVSSVNAATISSATIGGVSATIAAQFTGSGTSNVGILCAAVPTGATGDIVITMSAGVGRMGIGVWAVYDLSSTSAIATASSNADPATLNLNTAVGDLIFAVGYNNGNTSATPTGYTERYDAVDGDGCTHTGGDFVATVAETPRSISLDWATASGAQGAVCATFR